MEHLFGLFYRDKRIFKIPLALLLIDLIFKFFTFTSLESGFITVAMVFGHDSLDPRASKTKVIERTLSNVLSVFVAIACLFIFPTTLLDTIAGMLAIFLLYNTVFRGKKIALGSSCVGLIIILQEAVPYQFNHLTLERVLSVGIACIVCYILEIIL